MSALLINQQLIGHDSLRDCWSTNEMRWDVENLSWLCNASTVIYYSQMRCEDNLLFPKSMALSACRMPVAEYDPNFKMTYEEITDLKAQELLKISEESGMPIKVGWSGGIDSTVVLAALFKWARPADYERIIITTNKSAIWEYSSFFFDHIVPRKLKILEYDRHASSLNPSNFSGYLYVNGHPNDQLLIGLNSSSEVALNNPQYLTTSWKNTQCLKEYMSAYWKKQGFADWLVSKLYSNMDSLNEDIPIESCYDLVRWFNFNYCFTSAYSNDYGHIYSHISGVRLDQWSSHAYQWFADVRYQKWAMVNFNRLDTLLGPKLDKWKWPAKKYIYDYDRDEFYFNYKTKMGSSGRRSMFGQNLNRTAKQNRWAAIAPDYRFLTIEDNLDELKELLVASLRGNVS